ncbi:MAG: prepilin-type N-terminal cleavage/methylation domain-containing protein [Planctomycetota bacterium]|jgi:type II secretory pathway pseudopilin PulG
MGCTAIKTFRCRASSFTLVELLLALAISALVTASVAAMMVAVSYGTSSSRDLRSLLVKSSTIDARLSAAVRGSRSILASGSDFLILWTADADDDDTTDNAEVRLIERDPTTDELNTYYDTGAAGDYSDATAFRTAAKASYAYQRWGTGLTAISFVLDAAPPGTGLVSYDLTLASAEVSETVVGAAAIRN